MARRPLGASLLAALALAWPVDLAMLPAPANAASSTDLSAQNRRGQRPGAHRPPGVHRPRPPAARPPGAHRPRPPGVHRPRGSIGRPAVTGLAPRATHGVQAGAIAAGAALGFLAAGAAAWAGPPPRAGLCWYYTDWTQRSGFWDVCP